MAGRQPADRDRDSRLFKLLRRWLAGAEGMRSKHGANLALDILAANGIAEIAVVRDGRRIHLSTRDKVIASSVLRGGSFGADNMASFAALLAARGLSPQALTFVNIGANIGTACLNAYDHGFRRFVAAEPEPENFRLLRLNLDGLAHAEVRLVPSAVGERRGRARLHRHPRNKGAHSLLDSGRDGGIEAAVEVEVLPLDELYAASGPFVLFVDVEGFEPQVLRGGADVIARDCRAMALEVTPARYAPEDKADLCRRLAAFSDELFVIPSGVTHPTSRLASLMDEHPKGHFDIALLR